MFKQIKYYIFIYYIIIQILHEKEKILYNIYRKIFIFFVTYFF